MNQASVSLHVWHIHIGLASSWWETILIAAYVPVTKQSSTQSFHYFNSYAVLDRCDFSSFEDTISSPVNLSDYDVEKLLPSSSDLEHLYQNFSTLVGRMLTEHVPGFAKYKHLAKDHIQHIYDKEMSKPSTVVSHLVTIIIIVLHANIYQLYVS